MRLAFTTLALLISVLIIAQAPALIPYQAIARNAAGEPFASSTLNARFTIHDGTATGTSVWQELQTVSTTELGLFTVQLGSSIPLLYVNWASGDKFLQVELNLGNGFIDMGTQQLLSVPYALHARSAETANNGFANVSNAGDTLFLANGSFIIIPGISEANISSLNEDTQHTCGEPNIHNPNLTYGSMTDQEGNLYKTIIIGEYFGGSHEWMAENLTTSIYRNGDSIETNLDNVAWLNTSDGAWCYYNDDTSNACPFGKLYNWYTCSDSRGLCPVGWHIPTDEEWSVLESFLGNLGLPGNAIKTTGSVEAGSGLWSGVSLFGEGTNSSGFSGPPGGYRGGYSEIQEGFFSINNMGYWWSSSEVDSFNVLFRAVASWSDQVYTEPLDKHYGLSVRCIRD